MQAPVARVVVRAPVVTGQVVPGPLVTRATRILVATVVPAAAGPAGPALAVAPLVVPVVPRVEVRRVMLRAEPGPVVRVRAMPQVAVLVVPVALATAVPVVMRRLARQRVAPARVGTSGTRRRRVEQVVAARQVVPAEPPRMALPPMAVPRPELELSARPVRRAARVAQVQRAVQALVAPRPVPAVLAVPAVMVEQVEQVERAMVRSAVPVGPVGPRPSRRRRGLPIIRAAQTVPALPTRGTRSTGSRRVGSAPAMASTSVVPIPAWSITAVATRWSTTAVRSSAS